MSCVPLCVYIWGYGLFDKEYMHPLDGLLYIFGRDWRGESGATALKLLPGNSVYELDWLLYGRDATVREILVVDFTPARSVLSVKKPFLNVSAITVLLGSMHKKGYVTWRQMAGRISLSHTHSYTRSFLLHNDHVRPYILCTIYRGELHRVEIKANLC